MRRKSGAPDYEVHLIRQAPGSTDNGQKNFQRSQRSNGVNDFPEFMKNPVNRIASSTQYTRGIEGYLFDGADGSQMAVWTNHNGEKSAKHTHDYDEYFLVVQGQYVLILGMKRITVRVGEECFIPKGVPHSGESTAGTRTIHAFGGKRAQREGDSG
jgi:quercetin dioxygenase-like cupin family protein